MTRNDVTSAFWKFTLDDVEIRSANSACSNPNEHLIRDWRRFWNFPILQRRCFYGTRLLQNACFHRLYFSKIFCRKASPGGKQGGARLSLRVVRPLMALRYPVS